MTFQWGSTYIKVDKYQFRRRQLDAVLLGDLGDRRIGGTVERGELFWMVQVNVCRRDKDDDESHSAK